jgi:hypothetical protein
MIINSKKGFDIKNTLRENKQARIIYNVHLRCVTKPPQAVGVGFFFAVIMINHLF